MFHHYHSGPDDRAFFLQLKTRQRLTVATSMIVAGMFVFAGAVSAQQPAAAPSPPPTPAATPAPSTPPSNPQSKETVIVITATPLLAPVPKASGSETVISAPQIQHADPDMTIAEIIAQSAPGASDNPDNGLRIRGADDQFSTYIDGVPVPLSITGSLTDTFDPKDILDMHVYTGGFPAMYGGQLSGVFAIDSKTGSGPPSGSVAQSAASYDTYDSYGTVGGGSGAFDYFASGSRRETNFFLTPPVQTAMNDDGHEDHAFVKLDYKTDSENKLMVQLGANGSNFQIPGTLYNQQETGNLANLIWDNTVGRSASQLALYTRRSSLIYTGNPDDVVDEGLLDTNQNQQTTYVGLREDEKLNVGNRHVFGVGFDVLRATTDQNFVVTLPPPPAGPGGALSDDNGLHSWDSAIYLQDDWTPGRFAVNYGVRYDVDSQVITTNQTSPRVNIKYHTNGSDTLHAYYDRLFQPIPVEDATRLVGQPLVGDNGTLSPLQPERDTLYEVGYDHDTQAFSAGIAAYYKTGHNVRDDDQVGNTDITLPVDDAKAYFRGVEFTLGRTFSHVLRGFANYSLSWNKNAGPVSGGLTEGIYPTTYFYDDHDQTNTAIFGLSYDHYKGFADLDGEYGSGQPYGEIDNAAGTATDVNYLRVPVHLTFSADAGSRFGHGLNASLFADNIFNDGYVIKQITDLSNAQWAQGRVVGVRLGEDF